MGEPKVVKIGNKEVPIPLWAMHTAWVVALLGGIGYGLWWFNDHRESDKIRISWAEKVQLSEAVKHFDEDPLKEFIAIDDTSGLLKLQVYGSDKCVRTVRRDGQGPTQTGFLPDAAKATAPPTAITLLDRTDLTFATAAYAGGGCYPNHPGRYREWQERRDQCWIEAFRQFEDSCVVSQMYNSCYGYWEADGNGAPILRWHRCIH